MPTHREQLDLLDLVLTDGARRGALFCDAVDAVLDGRHVTIEGRRLRQFSSCSYLGLEHDPRLKQGAIEATVRFGTQFSSSRAYLSAPPYGILEELLEEIFEAPVIATPSTSLAHICALPVIVGERDLLLLDHQVHHSVHAASHPLRLNGTDVDLVRHGRLDQLEERIHESASRYEQVWFAVDGIYSMFGDPAPMPALLGLLDRYPRFRLYVDDAHGMSWSGLHGRGHALARTRIHPRMVLATSLNKSFAAGGGVLVFPDAEQRRRVRTCGGPLTYGGPIQPPMLGAAIASARIHLSPEIETLQDQLQDRIALFTEHALERRLPLVSNAATPIRFIACGLPRVSYNMIDRIAHEGFHVNGAAFPVVPMKWSGLRITLNRQHRNEDIAALVDALDRHLGAAFREEGQDPTEVFERLERLRARLGGGGTTPASESPPPIPLPVRPARATSRPLALRLECFDGIEAISRDEWDQAQATRGALGWDALRFYERCFRDRAKPEERWDFRYVRILDDAGRVRLSTFFTLALWKDDMLAPGGVSAQVEERRRRDPYYLTTRVLSMGSLLTEGEHVATAPEIDPDTRNALYHMLFEWAGEEAAAQEAGAIVFRDFVDDDPARDAFMLESGFVKQAGPESFTLTLDHEDEAAYLASLTYRARRFQRREVKPYDDHFEMEILRPGSSPDRRVLRQLHALYENVKRRNLELNTFALPGDFFEQILDPAAGARGWEIQLFRLAASHGGGPDSAPVACGVCFAGPEQYVPVVLGLNYTAVETHGLYRQCLRHAIARARALGLRRVEFGMGAPLEKQRFGARATRRCFYVQSEDHFGAEVLASMGDGRG